MKTRKFIIVAILALDHAFINNKQIFWQVKQVYYNPSYKIQTKFDILYCNFPIFKLMFLPLTINLEILVLTPNLKRTLHIVVI